ncbi:hypothetical protein ACHAPO_009089 [Fusarium lateritium]
MGFQEPKIIDIQELKHVHASFLKRPTRAPPPAFRTKPNVARLNASEWPELPKIPGFKKPTTVGSGVTTADIERLARETRQEEDALTEKELYRQLLYLPTPTHIWVARLREDFHSGTLLCTPHEIGEGRQVERILHRSNGVTNLW